MKEYFTILELEEDATYEEVKSARVNLLKKYHPDLSLGNPKYAKMKTREINEAFENLKRFFEEKKLANESGAGNKSVQNQYADKRVYERDAKEKALEKLNKKTEDKNNRLSGKNLLDISIMLLFCLVIILFFILIFS